MASTYTPDQAIAYAKRFVKNAPIDHADTKAQLLDTAYRFLWMAAPWSWTLGALPIITLAEGTQDYNVTDPGDFLRLEWAGRTRSSDRLEELAIAAALPEDTTYKQTPTKIAFVAIDDGDLIFRLWPVPATASERIITLYKKTSVKITAANSGNAVLVFPDEFFPLYQEIVLQKAMVYLQDARAGSASLGSNGQWSYTGQLATVMTLVEQYRRNEPTVLTTLGVEARSEGSRG